MTSLPQYLSLFTQTTLERSLSYVKKVDVASVQIRQMGQRIYIHATVSGTFDYLSNLVYDPRSARIISAHCSCPVQYNCKHCAALARYYYQDINKEQKKNQVLSPLVANDIDHELNLYPQFIYVLNQQSELVADLLKVRRGAQGQIRDAKMHTLFQSVLDHHFDLSQDEYLLFEHLYHYALKQSSSDRSGLNLNGLSLDSFKQLIQSELCYWANYRTKALKWSNQAYALEWQWEQNLEDNTEKLTIDLIDPMLKRIVLDPSNHDYVLLNTQPVCLLNALDHHVHPLTQAYSVETIHYARQLPEIPANQVEKVMQRLNQGYSEKISSEPASDIHGDATAVIRFGYSSIALARAQKKYKLEVAEIFFEYTTGRTSAFSPHLSFYTQQDNRLFCQHRNVKQEQQAIDRLYQIVPNLKQLSQLNSAELSGINDNAFAAQYQDWMNQLYPINHLNEAGFKIEHLDNSPFNLNYAEHVELSLNRSEHDWFDVGAQIEDKNGQKYDLIELLASLVQAHAYLLDPHQLEQLDDSLFFSIKTSRKGPNIALQVKDFRPILKYLGDLVLKERPSIDRYDLDHLFQLSQETSVHWQNSESAKQLAIKFRQGPIRLETPEMFQGELRPYQQQGLGWLQFLVQTGHGGILADDMGLGKTAQTLAHILLEKQAGRLHNKPVLIVAPTSLMHNWYKESQRFTPDLRVLILQGHQRHSYFEHMSDYDIILSTYPLLPRDAEQLKQQSFYQIILDEAQMIKNPKSRAAQVASSLNAKHRLCLTGTPMENHLGELWSLFNFLMPGFLSSYERFNQDYRYPIEKQDNFYQKEKLIHRIQPFLLRRLKTEVAKELPLKTTIEVSIDMNEQQSRLYEAVRASMQKNIRQLLISQGLKRSQLQILDALLKLRQICCHPALLKLDQDTSGNIHSAKLDHLMSMVVSMLEEGRKILIFSQFTQMLALIEKALVSADIKYVKLTGQSKKREEIIERFQNGEVPVFLISLKAGGVGLNLTAADTVIHYDPWWNPAVEDQASDRAWRIGQTKPVFVYKLITTNSIEEKILALQKHKATISQSIISSSSNLLSQWSEDTLLDLLEAF